MLWINPGILRVKTNVQSFDIKLPVLLDHSLAIDMAGPAESTLLAYLPDTALACFFDILLQSDWLSLRRL